MPPDRQSITETMPLAAWRRSQPQSPSSLGGAHYPGAKSPNLNRLIHAPRIRERRAVKFSQDPWVSANKLDVGEAVGSVHENGPGRGGAHHRPVVLPLLGRPALRRGGLRGHMPGIPCLGEPMPSLMPHAGRAYGTR